KAYVPVAEISPGVGDGRRANRASTDAQGLFSATSHAEAQGSRNHLQLRLLARMDVFGRPSVRGSTPLEPQRLAAGLSGALQNAEPVPYDGNLDHVAFSYLRVPFS